MFIMDFDDFFIAQFFLASFRPSPKLPRHTCGPFASHQCAEAHRLKIDAMKTYGEWRYISTILDLGATWRWKVSFTSNFSPGEKAPVPNG
jgi:hypothetical protein